VFYFYRKMSNVYNQPIAAEMENQVFYLQNMVKVLTKRLDDLVLNGGLTGPPGRDGEDGTDGVDGVDGQTPDLTNYVLRSEIIRPDDGNIRIGTNAIDWVKLGRYRIAAVGTALHIADSYQLKEVILTLDQNCLPDLE
jgi:hypothetical protein